MFGGLREEVIFGGKPSLKAMIVFTTKVIDFHEFGARDRTL
jgi:hypothetical protein